MPLYLIFPPHVFSVIKMIALTKIFFFKLPSQIQGGDTKLKIVWPAHITMKMVV